MNRPRRSSARNSSQKDSESQSCLSQGEVSGLGCASRTSPAEPFEQSQAERGCDASLPQHLRITCGLDPCERFRMRMLPIQPESALHDFSYGDNYTVNFPNMSGKKLWAGSNGICKLSPCSRRCSVFSLNSTKCLHLLIIMIWNITTSSSLSSKSLDLRDFSEKWSENPWNLTRWRR